MIDSRTQEAQDRLASLEQATSRWVETMLSRDDLWKAVPLYPVERMISRSRILRLARVERRKLAGIRVADSLWLSGEGKFFHMRIDDPFGPYYEEVDVSDIDQFLLVRLVYTTSS